MESLALLVSLIFLSVLLSGPLAWFAVGYNYPHVGTLLGVYASISGVWWAYTVRSSAGWVGVFSAAMGVWALMQAWHQLPAE